MSQASGNSKTSSSDAKSVSTLGGTTVATSHTFITASSAAPSQAGVMGPAAAAVAAPVVNPLGLTTARLAPRSTTSVPAMSTPGSEPSSPRSPQATTGGTARSHNDNSVTPNNSENRNLLLTGVGQGWQTDTPTPSSTRRPGSSSAAPESDPNRRDAVPEASDGIRGGATVTDASGHNGNDAAGDNASSDITLSDDSDADPS